MIESLAKKLFWICCVLLILIFAAKINQAVLDNQLSEQAAHAENHEACSAIDSFKYQAQCYSKFIDSGYVCTSDPCYFAYAIHIEDDWYCDKAFPTNVPVNLECRVSVFIERYTHEGLSDCCHI